MKGPLEITAHAQQGFPVREGPVTGTETDLAAVYGAVSGQPPGWFWELPQGPACAAHARAVLADALGALGVPRDTVADAQLMVSELATNAHQHAGAHGPHELWLCLGESAARAGHSHEVLRPVDARLAGEVRCAVFDGFVDARLPGYSWTSGDCGRGLGIVGELSEGRWGVLRTLSRLGTPVPGKAVWFAVPVPGEPDAAH